MNADFPGRMQSLIAANLRAERARAHLGQEDVAARMRELGYAYWVRQTVSKSESRTPRRVTADEIFGLAIALGTSAGRLMAGSGE